jgi:type IV secretory pathway VirB3-like protein
VADTVPGWTAPVFQGMADPPQYKGVPILFFAGNLLGSLFTAVCLIQAGQIVYAVMALGGGGVIYLGMLVGCTIEPRFLGLWWDYVTYTNRYEG